MAFWVYIVRCNDDSYYTGHTDNLELRVAGHNADKFRGFTFSRRPVELVFYQECVCRDDAFRLERQIKGWSRAKKQAMIRKDWDKISQLARNRSAHPSTDSG